METSDQQNSPTGKPNDKPSDGIEMKNGKSTLDEDYLNGLIAKASKTWKGIDAEEWLNEIRGDYAE